MQVGQVKKLVGCEKERGRTIVEKGKDQGKNAIRKKRSTVVKKAKVDTKKGTFRRVFLGGGD